LKQPEQPAHLDGARSSLNSLLALTVLEAAALPALRSYGKGE